MTRYLLIFALLLGAVSSWGQKYVSDLVVSPAFGGGTIKWYNAANAGTEYTSPATTVLVNGQKYYASQTVNGVESTDRKEVTATVAPLTASPVVTSPINNGATSVSGTSSEADNTTIEIFVDGSSIGIANVAIGAWSKTSLTALTTGQAVTAKATAPGECLSSASNSVTVTANQTTAPTVSSPISVSGNLTVTNNDAEGAALYFYVDQGSGYSGLYTSSIVASGQSLTINVEGLVQNYKVSAKAKALVKTQSNYSNEVIVTP